MACFLESVVVCGGVRLWSAISAEFYPSLRTDEKEFRASYPSDLGSRLRSGSSGYKVTMSISGFIWLRGADLQSWPSLGI